MTRSDAAERSDRLCRLQNDPAEKSPPHPAAVDACPVTEVPVLTYASAGRRVSARLSSSLQMTLRAITHLNIAATSCGGNEHCAGSHALGK
ncbi:hypothetical protein PC119_g2467 [Phytophthora cactorum]|uniref:Uncharacterized protein n=1 Tax=Phytophthora cactorum TaxID=29920 RepID=A0A8T0ZVE1_9STRA|nr:hypothetical protein PC111_g2826 [Phytophthora cactorum]KAG2866308.1 hypothetical protein PC113_g2960 [Phytophthora cactorum]KAG2940496.1 hypothetical protein PC115_g2568 [Phytophthora cactorum]KAG3039032.1 hypothetical protein PC119_g2467 [Phytophthora cactorum]KAG3200202.1 hypothetical protein PC128_g4742 [Phytophthora cactorum]